MKIRLLIKSDAGELEIDAENFDRVLKAINERYEDDGDERDRLQLAHEQYVRENGSDVSIDLPGLNNDTLPLLTVSAWITIDAEPGYFDLAQIDLVEHLLAMADDPVVASERNDEIAPALRKLADAFEERLARAEAKRLVMRRAYLRDRPEERMPDDPPDEEAS